MDIRMRVVGTVTVLEPMGRMVLGDHPAGNTLKDEVATQLREGRRQFVLDLNQVSQMDTSGLAALVTVHIAVRKQHGRIVLVSPPNRVRELLHVTRLDVVFQVFDGEADALESLTRESQTQS